MVRLVYVPLLVVIACQLAAPSAAMQQQKSLKPDDMIRALRKSMLRQVEHASSLLETEEQETLKQEVEQHTSDLHKAFRSNAKDLDSVTTHELPIYVGRLVTELREHQEKAPAALVEVTSSIRGKNTQQQVATPTESGAKAWLKNGWRQLTKILHAILNRIGHALDPDNISFSVELGVGMSFGSFAITWSQPLAAADDPKDDPVETAKAAVEVPNSTAEGVPAAPTASKFSQWPAKVWKVLTMQDFLEYSKKCGPEGEGLDGPSFTVTFHEVHETPHVLPAMSLGFDNHLGWCAVQYIDGVETPKGTAHDSQSWERNSIGNSMQASGSNEKKGLLWKWAEGAKNGGDRGIIRAIMKPFLSILKVLEGAVELIGLLGLDDLTQAVTHAVDCFNNKDTCKAAAPPVVYEGKGPFYEKARACVDSLVVSTGLLPVPFADVSIEADANKCAGVTSIIKTFINVLIKFVKAVAGLATKKPAKSETPQPPALPANVADEKAKPINTKPINTAKKILETCFGESEHPTKAGKTTSLEVTFSASVSLDPLTAGWSGGIGFGPATAMENCVAQVVEKMFALIPGGVGTVLGVAAKETILLPATLHKEVSDRIGKLKNADLRTKNGIGDALIAANPGEALGAAAGTALNKAGNKISADAENRKTRIGKAAQNCVGAACRLIGGDLGGK